MTLIKCPECGKEISDKSEVCIHCGYPLNPRINTKCVINGTEYDLGFILDNEQKRLYKVRDLIQIIHCDVIEAGNIVDNIQKTQTIPKYLNVKVNDVSKNNNQIKCPTCQSTNVVRISTTAKVANAAMFGLLGNKRKKTFHCNNCKYEW